MFISTCQSLLFYYKATTRLFFIFQKSFKLGHPTVAVLGFKLRAAFPTLEENGGNAATRAKIVHGLEKKYFHYSRWIKYFYESFILFVPSL